MSSSRKFWPYLLLVSLGAVLRCGGDITVPAEGLPSRIQIISGDDQTGVVGDPLPDSLVVRITDSKDRPVVDQPVEFTSVSAGAAQDLIPDTATTGADGRAWSHWVLGTRAGTLQVKARALGRAPIEATFTATAQPGPPHALSLIGGAGQSGVVGAMLDDSLLVRVVDQFNNPLANQIVSWTAEDGGTVSDATTPTDAIGRAGIRWRLGDMAGTQTSRATIAALPGSPLDFTATALPGSATAVEKVFGDNQSAPVGSDLTDSVVIRVVDAFGNGVPGRSLSWVLVGTGGSVNPGSSTTDATGEAFTRWSLGPVAGQQVLRAAVPGFAPVSFVARAQSLQPATIGAASSTQLNGTAGQPVTPAPSVEVQDANGNPVSGVTVTFTVISGGGQVSNGSGQGNSVKVSTDAGGNAKVASWTLGPVAGNGQLEARATGPSGPLSGSPVSFTSSGAPGSATQLAFLQQPASAVAGQPIAPPITVAVQDANGNTVLSSSVTVRLALGNNQTGGTLSGPATIDAINGVATFGALSVDRTGTGYTLVATASGGLHSATSAAFGITPGPAAQLAIVTQPQAAPASGTLLSPQPVIRLEDGLGNTVSRSNVPVTVSISSGGGSLSGTTTVATDNSGIATFTNVALSGLVGQHVLLFSASGLQDVTSAPLTLKSGPAAAIALNAGNGQSAPVGSTVAVAPSVEVTDASGNPVAGFAVAFAVATGGGSVTGANAVSGPSGFATIGSWRLGPTKGSNTLTATAPGLSGSPLSFSATALFAYETIAAGSEFSCGVSSAGIPYCWGRNDRGQIGNGNLTDQTSPALVAGGFQFISIGLGDSHACGIVASGAAFCWGDNSDGQLGDGTTTDHHTPNPVDGGHSFASIDGGESHTCALTQSGAAWCWGRNDRGQLGDGSRTDRDMPVAVAGGLQFTAISLGASHTCALSTGGTIYCWGSNANGQLGDGTRRDQNRPTPVAGTWTAVSAGEDFSCGLQSGGIASCWGRNDKGQIGDGTTMDRSSPTPVSGGLAFVQVDPGDRHACAIVAAGTTYCWGQNNDGELGDGTTSDRQTPVAVQGSQTFAGVNAGGRHTIALDPSGVAYGWGRDANGQLGTGSGGNKLTPVLVIEP
ncbi:MAG TPA: hypothetical protein VH438_05415 [Gemmatimonadales bacterium]